MPSKKASKANAQEEQLRLLGQILAELQRLNANLAAVNAGRHATMGLAAPSDSDEELQEYE